MNQDDLEQLDDLLNKLWGSQPNLSDDDEDAILWVQAIIKEILTNRNTTIDNPRCDGYVEPKPQQDKRSKLPQLVDDRLCGSHQKLYDAVNAIIRYLKEKEANQ